MRKLWFAIQYKTSDGRYRAFATSVGENDNLKGFMQSFDTSEREILTINCWPKAKCMRVVDAWNEGFRAQGKLY